MASPVVDAQLFKSRIWLGAFRNPSRSSDQWKQFRVPAELL